MRLSEVSFVYLRHSDKESTATGHMVRKTYLSLWFQLALWKIKIPSDTQCGAKLLRIRSTWGWVS